MHPILSCKESLDFETQYFQSSGFSEYAAMEKAGIAAGNQILCDYREITNQASSLHCLVLIGKGHNGGDALLSMAQIVEVYKTFHSKVEDASFHKKITFDLISTHPSEKLRKNTQRALQFLLSKLKPEKYYFYEGFSKPDLTDFENKKYQICLDGILGMQFRSPLSGFTKDLILFLNNHISIQFKASIDLPSGVSDQWDKNASIADFTYATGIYKKPLINRNLQNKVGRVRYLDLDFFSKSQPKTNLKILTKEILLPLRKMRPALAEKRQFGKLALLGGSFEMPGAIAMACHSALQSGSGLIQAFTVPQHIPNLAIEYPEIMWMSCPANTKGWISGDPDPILESMDSFAEVSVVGPGMGRHPETLEFLKYLLPRLKGTLILDADALIHSILETRLDQVWKAENVIITPHLGEFKRLFQRDLKTQSLDSQFLEYCRQRKLLGVLKGPQTRITNGQELLINPTGGPVLSRGGSGDILSGLMGSTIAQLQDLPILENVARAVFWHGLSADLTAQRQGQVAIRTTSFIEHFSEALRIST